MTETKHGMDKFLLFRKYSEAAEKGAAKLALQTTHELTFENDNELKQTKDGAKALKGATTYSLSISAISSRDEVNLMLEDAAEANERLEIWEVDYGAGEDEEGKYNAKYMQGYLNNWNTPSNAEETVELETEATIEGKPQRGKVLLTEVHKNEILYAFRDIAPLEVQGEE